MLCAGMMLFASVLPQLPYDDMNVSAAYDDVYTYGDFEYKDMYGSIYITAYSKVILILPFEELFT